jgi:hypothetical protein
MWGPQDTVVVEAPPSWRALASLKNFLGVIDVCRCVLANFEGKLEQFKTTFLSSNSVFLAFLISSYDFYESDAKSRLQCIAM